MAQGSNGLTFSFNNLEKVKKDFNLASEQAVQGVIKAGVASMLDIQTTAKKPGYVPYRTGNLKRSITSNVDVRKSGDKIQIGTVGSNLVYARIQEYGGSTGRNHKTKIIGKFYLTRAISDNIEKLRRRFQAIKLLNK